MIEKDPDQNSSQETKSELLIKYGILNCRYKLLEIIVLKLDKSAKLYRIFLPVWYGSGGLLANC